MSILFKLLLWIIIKDIIFFCSENFTCMLILKKLIVMDYSCKDIYQSLLLHKYHQIFQLPRVTKKLSLESQGCLPLVPSPSAEVSRRVGLLIGCLSLSSDFPTTQLGLPAQCRWNWIITYQLWNHFLQTLGQTSQEPTEHRLGGQHLLMEKGQRHTVGERVPEVGVTVEVIWENAVP